jgi:hypothetical protein
MLPPVGREFYECRFRSSFSGVIPSSPSFLFLTDGEPRDRRDVHQFFVRPHRGSISAKQIGPPKGGPLVC